MLKAAQATCDFYIENSPTDGIPYWDTGAPQLYRMGDYLNKPADPFNAFQDETGEGIRLWLVGTQYERIADAHGLQPLALSQSAQAFEVDRYIG